MTPRSRADCTTLTVEDYKVVKPTRVATDWMDGDKFTRLMKTWRFHACISINVNHKNTVMTSFLCTWLQITLQN